MTRTQIQLPDDVYERARKVCESREISMAELARRGFEYMLSIRSVPLKIPVNIDDYRRRAMAAWVKVEQGPVKRAFSRRA